MTRTVYLCTCTYILYLFSLLLTFWHQMEVFWLVWTSLVIWTGHRDVLPSFLGRPNVNCKVKSCFCKFDRPEKDQNLKRFPYLPWTRYADFGLYFESEVSLAFSLTVFLSSGPPSFAKNHV